MNSALMFLQGIQTTIYPLKFSNQIAHSHLPSALRLIHEWTLSWRHGWWLFGEGGDGGKMRVRWIRPLARMPLTTWLAPCRDSDKGSYGANQNGGCRSLHGSRFSLGSNAEVSGEKTKVLHIEVNGRSSNANRDGKGFCLVRSNRLDRARFGRRKTDAHLEETQPLSHGP